MRAIRVEVKWTVLSSAMGMFIFTRRYRNDGGGGAKQVRDTHISAARSRHSHNTTLLFERKQPVCC